MFDIKVGRGALTRGGGGAVARSVKGEAAMAQSVKGEGAMARSMKGEEPWRGA